MQASLQTRQHGFGLNCPRSEVRPLLGHLQHISSRVLTFYHRTNRVYVCTLRYYPSVLLSLLLSSKKKKKREAETRCTLTFDRNFSRAFQTSCSIDCEISPRSMDASSLRPSRELHVFPLYAEVHTVLRGFRRPRSVVHVQQDVFVGHCFRKSHKAINNTIVIKIIDMAHLAAMTSSRVLQCFGILQGAEAYDADTANPTSAAWLCPLACQATEVFQPPLLGS